MPIQLAFLYMAASPILFVGGWSIGWLLGWPPAPWSIAVAQVPVFVGLAGLVTLPDLRPTSRRARRWLAVGLGAAAVVPVGGVLAGSRLVPVADLSLAVRLREVGYGLVLAAPVAAWASLMTAVAVGNRPPGGVAAVAGVLWAGVGLIGVGGVAGVLWAGVVQAGAEGLQQIWSDRSGFGRDGPLAALFVMACVSGGVTIGGAALLASYVLVSMARSTAALAGWRATPPARAAHAG